MSHWPAISEGDGSSALESGLRHLFTSQTKEPRGTRRGKWKAAHNTFQWFLFNIRTVKVLIKTIEFGHFKNSIGNVCYVAECMKSVECNR